MCLCARAREYARAGRGTRAGERCSRTTAATDLLRRCVCAAGERCSCTTAVTDLLRRNFDLGCNLTAVVWDKKCVPNPPI